MNLPSQYTTREWLYHLVDYLKMPCLIVPSSNDSSIGGQRVPLQLLSHGSVRLDIATGDLYYRPNDSRAGKNLDEVVATFNKAHPDESIAQSRSIINFASWVNAFSQRPEHQRTEDHESNLDALRTLSRIASCDRPASLDHAISLPHPKELGIVGSADVSHFTYYRIADMVPMLQRVNLLQTKIDWNDWDVVGMWIELYDTALTCGLVCSLSLPMVHEHGILSSATGDSGDDDDDADDETYASGRTVFVTEQLFAHWVNGLSSVPTPNNGLYNNRALSTYLLCKTRTDRAIADFVDFLEERDNYSDARTLAARYPRANVQVTYTTSTIAVSGALIGAHIVQPMFGAPYISVTVEQYTVIRGTVEPCFTNIRLSLNGEGATFREYTSESNQRAVARGRTMVKMNESRSRDLNSADPVYVHTFNGPAYIPGMFGLSAIHVSGTVVYDPIGAKRTNLSGFNSLTSHISFQGSEEEDDNGHSERIIDVTSEFVLASMLPEYVAYSFEVRDWVLASVEHSAPLVHDHTIFDKLVLAESEKTKVRSIVTNLETDFVDIVAGKGGGAIFLLYGPAGLGKTLTAEAVSAVCNSPLYKVTVGELGTSVDKLEKALSRVLNYASRWGATILIDEADIFLEARDSHNIERNAMVGVFLRLLEYYPGIMFLTTNRVANFDTAFFSRITYAIGFRDQTEADRIKVWNNLLKSAKLDITTDQVKELSALQVNNRQIKTAITNAHRFARHDNVPCSYSHVKQAIESIVEFNKAVQQSTDGPVKVKSKKPKKNKRLFG